MITKSIKLNSALLAIFALATALVLATTHFLTKDRITEAERVAAQQALFEIIPTDRHNNDLLVDLQPIPEQYWQLLGLPEGGNIYIARFDEEPIAAIIPSVTPKGYSGDIEMIVGINFDGKIAGVRVTEHKETPGLGDKVELRKSDWILSFNGKSLSNTNIEGWDVKKNKGDFDQFTGATITPRAVIHQIAETLNYFESDRERLLKEIQPQQAKAVSNQQES